MSTRTTRRLGRRGFLESGAAWAASGALGLGPLHRAHAADGRARFSRRDRFGGCPDIRFEASGFFRVHKADRLWLVTPEGNAYLSLGINHIQMDLFHRAPNKAFWAKRFGSDDPQSEIFREGARRKVEADMRAFGFNALGTHSDAMVYPRGFAPFVRPVRFVEIPHWKTPGPEQFLDVFSEAFTRHCDEVARKRALPLRDDPHLIGYSFTDCPIFTDQDAAARSDTVYGARRPALPTWPRVLRNLPGTASGKQAYVRTMRRLHGDSIASFNRAYGTSFAGFGELAAATRWRPETDSRNAQETRDNRAFLEEVVDRYYRIATGALRRHDPNHLILGDKLNGNTDGADAVVAISSKYTDVFYYQAYGLWDEQRPMLDRWSSVTGKAILNGDSTYSVPAEMMPSPFGPHCRDQKDRARRVLEFATNAFARPDFVGWHVCGWMDMWKTFEGKEHKQHAGLQTIFGEHYQPMRETLAQVSARLYDLARPPVRGRRARAG